MSEDILSEDTVEDEMDICDCGECEDCIKESGECTCGDCDVCLATAEDLDDIDDIEDIYSDVI
ncbi:hypothetical protein A2442_01840 [Candidatus Campbellbacteria bacterium RIFOXYC2_FULL_35_25]|uniref:Uncharacterized protein n=1 Tax=Candidatus Campbellbacteria bacterium RIFOXYC2_FULL_35_25 TaxID=1797582 RepID=A0A1F5EI86_9BACT|nr:MAG: hypothetical protein A2442_01840 [Candidatus Campbellbacteria bacterium RIFOXYC2_FULL_35_25]